MSFRSVVSTTWTSHRLVHWSRLVSSSSPGHHLGRHAWSLQPCYQSTLADDVHSPAHLRLRARTLCSTRQLSSDYLTEKDVLPDGEYQPYFTPLNTQDGTNDSNAPVSLPDSAIDYYDEVSRPDGATRDFMHHSPETTAPDKSQQPCHGVSSPSVPVNIETFRGFLSMPGYLRVVYADSLESAITAYSDRMFKLSNGEMHRTTFERPDHKLKLIRQYFTKEIALSEAFLVHVGSDTTESSWKQDVRDTDDVWLAAVMIGAVIRSPECVLQTLRILKDVVQGFTVRAECLHAITQLYKKQLASEPSLLADFDELVNDLREEAHWPPRMALKHLKLFFRKPEPQKTEAVVQAWLKKYEHLASHTHLGRDSRKALARACLENDRIDMAADILKTLPEWLLSMPSKTTMRLCARALKFDPVSQNEEGVNFKRLPQLLKAGLKPDALLYVRIAHSALVAGYPGVAWDLHNYTKTLDSTPEPLMYLTLLKHAFDDGDMAKVDELLSDIHTEQVLYTHPYIVAYTMHMIRVISLTRGRAATQEILASMFAIFDRGFRRDTLVRLGIVGESLMPGDERREPTPNLLAHVLRSCLLAGHGDSHGSTIWESLMNANRDGDGAITAALNEIILFDGFILFWSRRESTLPKGLEIMRYLLANNTCVPTAHTWSILICAYLKHEKIEEAQSLVKLMESHGVTTAELAQDTMGGARLIDTLKSRMEWLLNEEVAPEYPDESSFSPAPEYPDESSCSPEPEDTDSTWLPMQTEDDE